MMPGCNEELSVDDLGRVLHGLVETVFATGKMPLKPLAVVTGNLIVGPLEDQASGTAKTVWIDSAVWAVVPPLNVSSVEWPI
jgi:hypothetical protein